MLVYNVKKMLGRLKCFSITKLTQGHLTLRGQLYFLLLYRAYSIV